MEVLDDHLTSQRKIRLSKTPFYLLLVAIVLCIIGRNTLQFPGTSFLLAICLGMLLGYLSSAIFFYKSKDYILRIFSVISFAGFTYLWMNVFFGDSIPYNHRGMAVVSIVFLLTLIFHFFRYRMKKAT